MSETVYANYKYVIKSLNDAQTKEEFDSIFKEILNGEEKYKEILKDFVDFDRFSCSNKSVKKFGKNDAAAAVDINRLTKMVIDEPIVDEKLD